MIDCQSRGVGNRCIVVAEPRVLVDFYFHPIANTQIGIDRIHQLNRIDRFALCDALHVLQGAKNGVQRVVYRGVLARADWARMSQRRPRGCHPSSANG
jgi:hypothetical protein